MLKKWLITFFRRLGFSVKFTNLRITERYRVNKGNNGLNQYDTPTGKYYLPSYLKDDDVANTIKKGLCFEEDRKSVV